MSEATLTKTALKGKIDPTIPARILEEGYGPGAWHGADLRAAIEATDAKLAFWRPGKDRHNIAEIAAHHAGCVHSAIKQIGGPDTPFAIDGSDWFPLVDEGDMKWKAVKSLVEETQERLTETVASIDGGKLKSPLSAAERFELLLGVTCHAVYHAGQMQLVRALHG